MPETNDRRLSQIGKERTIKAKNDTLAESLTINIKKQIENEENNPFPVAKPHLFGFM
jgi:hypothetical protein